MASLRALTRERVLGNVAESQAAREASRFEIHAIVEGVPRLDVSTPVNGAIVWSNARGGNLALADRFIAENPGSQRLEMTPGGQYLESLNLFERYPYELARVPWERLSARYAWGASGQVTALTTGSSPSSIFRAVELPILRVNPMSRESGICRISEGQMQFQEVNEGGARRADGTSVQIKHPEYLEYRAGGGTPLTAKEKAELRQNLQEALALLSGNFVVR